MARMVSKDPKSITYRNLKYLEQRSSLNKPELYSSWRVKESLPVLKVPENEKWRLGMIRTLMKVKKQKYIDVEDMKQVCAMLDSLAST